MNLGTFDGRSTLMRGQVAFAAVAIAILAGAGLGYLAGAGVQRTTTQVLTTTEIRTTTACGTPSGVSVPVLGESPTNSSEQGVLALVLSPGSNATVLMDYCGYYSSSPLTLSPSALTCTVYGCMEPSPNITITSVPSEIALRNSEWVVAYHISANMNSKGHYLLDFPLEACPVPLLAVGYPPSALKISDFSGWYLHPCPNYPGYILDVEGAATTYVGFNLSSNQ